MPRLTLAGLLVALSSLVFTGSLCAAEPAPAASTPSSAPALHPPIAIPFKLSEPGFVTLVIEDANGVRVRNLISETEFPAGQNTAWWDGLDDLARDNDAAAHAIYHIPGKLVAPGTYRVRGLVRPQIGLFYEMTPYNEGKPPWHSAEKSSEWLANHTPPSAALFIPPHLAPNRLVGDANEGQILIGSYVSEGGSGVAWLDLNGRKMHGQMWIGGVWTGASHLARDEGEHGLGGVYAYSGSWWAGDKYNGNQRELRLYELLSESNTVGAPKDHRFGYGEDVPVLKPTYKLAHTSAAGATRKMGMSGLAVRDGLLAVSLSQSDELLFIDAAAHRAIALAPLDDPRGLAFDKQGNLLALSGAKLVRLDVAAVRKLAEAGRHGPAPASASADDNTPPPPPPSVTLPPAQVLVAQGLDDPQQMTLGGDGAMYVSDQGKSHQVKVYSADGKALRTIGQAGGPCLGAYDPNRMHSPNGLTIDSRNRLWVAETDYIPKRVSLWSLDGNLLRVLYGPPEYGGGGNIDPLDKTRFFYAGMELKLDWDKGTSWPVAILYRTDINPFNINRSGPPQFPCHVEGRDYLANSHNSNPTGGLAAGLIWILKKGIATPAAAVGNVSDWTMFDAVPAFGVRWTGTITPPQSDVYTLYAQGAGGCRLWIDGNTVVDNWKDQNGKDQGKVELQAGRNYAIRFDYHYERGTAGAKLLWSTATQKTATVPAAALAAADAKDPNAAGLKAEYFKDSDLKELAETRVDPAINFKWAAKGPLATGENPFRARFPADANGPLMFAWTDLNGDGNMQADEITVVKGETQDVTVMPDLRIVTATGLLLKPEGFTPGGAPLYDPAKAQGLISGTQRPSSSGGGQALIGKSPDGKDGWLVLTTAPKPFAPQGVGGAINGRALWSYPSLWPGLHASHNAPLPDRPGEMLGTTRLLGAFVTPVGSDAGEIWGINGNKGNLYLMTADGLFVATLFADCRKAAWSFLEANQGMSVADASLGEENFWPSIAQTADGKIYVVAINGSIVRVEGLEKTRRLPADELAVTKDQLSAAGDYFNQLEAQRQADLKDQANRKLLVRIRATPPPMDGNLASWADANWVTIDQRTLQVGDWGHQAFKTEAAVAVAGDKLYVAVRSDNPRMLENTAESPRNLFKTGGAIDLMIGADPAADPKRKAPVAGDLRLLVSQVRDSKNSSAAPRTIAMLYRQVAPGAGGEAAPFSSPLRTVTFDQVLDVSSQVQLAVTIEKNEKLKRDLAVFELSVPLSVLALRPQAGTGFRGDVGILRGNGFETLQRSYWSNKAAGLTSDLPSEAELTPLLWGPWEFVAGK